MTVKPDHLACTLARVRKDGGDPPSNYWELTELMLQPDQIGHPDPTLRDDLIYSTLARWITGGAYDDHQLRHIVRTALDEEHLFHGFGSLNDETVLTRAFSVLLIPPALAIHRQRPALEAAEVQALAAPLERYLLGERDLRGYDVELGWVHAVAHASDAFGSLMRSSEVDAPTVIRLLNALRTAAATPHHVYAHGEDERLARAMAAGLSRPELTTTERQDWLAGFRDVVAECADLGMPEGYARLVNVNHTLRALYFLVREGEGPVGPGFASVIVRLLTEFSEL